MTGHVVVHIFEKLAEDKLECFAILAALLIFDKAERKDLVATLRIDTVEGQRKHAETALLLLLVAGADEESISVHQILFLHLTSANDDALNEVGLGISFIPAEVMLGKVSSHELEQLVRVLLFASVVGPLEDSFFFVDEP